MLQFSDKIVTCNTNIMVMKMVTMIERVHNVKAIIDIMMTVRCDCIIITECLCFYLRTKDKDLVPNAES